MQREIKVKMKKTTLLTVKIKNVFGRTEFWPECEISKKMCELVNQKCLTRKQIDILKTMNYRIQAKVEMV